MPSRNYWFCPFTGEQWEEFLTSGRRICTFSAAHQNRVAGLQPGDYLLCYLTGLGRFIGILRVTAQPLQPDDASGGESVDYWQVPVNPLIELTFATAKPARELKDSLDCFRNVPGVFTSIHPFRKGLVACSARDGEAVVAALLKARQHPAPHEVNAAKLGRRPSGVTSEIGVVTIPPCRSAVQQIKPQSAGIMRTATLIQALLLRLGHAMGFELWTCADIRRQDVDGKLLTQMPSVRQSLPASFDRATRDTIECLDVLWFNGDALVAVFAVEQGPRLSEKLLRLADLIALHAQTHIPLFWVGPQRLRETLIAQVNRPAFAILRPPLCEVLRLLTFEILRDEIRRIKLMASEINFDYLEEISESCEPELA